MPCDSIQLNKVAIDKLDAGLHRATDAELEALGWKIGRYNVGAVSYYHDATGRQVVYRAGTLESQMNPAQLATFRNTLAVAYSRQAVLVAAKRQGWKVRQVGPQQYEVQR